MSGLLAVAFAAALAVGAASPRGTLDINGSYAVRIVGAYEGTGTVRVSVNHVHINLPLKGPDGTKGRLLAPNMSLNGSRFSGTATFPGATVRISGRIDQLQNARIVCVLSDSQGRAARLVGVRQGTGQASDLLLDAQ